MQIARIYLTCFLTCLGLGLSGCSGGGTGNQGSPRSARAEGDSPFQRVVLIGEETGCVKSLRADLESAGIEVHSDGSIPEGSLVLFCVSCHDGPMPGTVTSLEKHDGEMITDFAFVLMNHISDAPSDLMELVELEMVDLVTRMMLGHTHDSIGAYDVIRVDEQGHITERDLQNLPLRARSPIALSTPPLGLMRDVVMGMNLPEDEASRLLDSQVAPKGQE